MSFRKRKGIPYIRIFIVACFCQWLLLLVPLRLQGQTRSFFFDVRSAAYKGLQLYEEGDYTAAITFLEQAVEVPKNRMNSTIQLKLAHAYSLTGAAKLAAEWYSLLQSSGFKLEGQHPLFYANALMGSGRLEEGREVLLQFLYDTGMESQAKILREQPLSDLYRDSIRYKVSAVSINSAAAEFSPVLVPHGIFFISERPKARLVQKRFSADESSGLDIFYGPIDSGGDVREMVRLNNVVNTGMPEGPVAMAANGKKLFFSRSGSNGKMQIFQAKSMFSLTGWYGEELVNIPGNPSVGHPAVARGGQLLYFISDMPGGYGGTDIYKTVNSGNGWSKPENLGPKINTAGNEMFPLIHAEDKLYFSSNGHFGLGGLDIYEAKLDGDSVTTIRNMGAPVNSNGDDFNLSINSSGTWGYFSSNREGGAGKDDIYRLDVNLITLAGKVVEKINGKGVDSIQVRLYQDEILLREALTDRQGNYSFSLYPGQEYELRYSGNEFRDCKETVSTRQGPRYGIRKWESGLDRKVKMFVLGTVKNGANMRAADAGIVVVDQLSGRVDTVFADKRGSYEMELDAFSQYTFLASCNGEAVLTNFSTPERGKASLSYYVNMVLQPAATYQLRGKVKAPNTEKAPFIISRLNRLTLEQDFIFSDDKGFFTFEAHSLAEYELCLMNDKGSPPLLLKSGWRQREREVVLSW